MTLPLLVVLSALGLLLAAWMLTGSIVVGVAAGMLAALAWGATPRLMIRRYLAADFDGALLWTRLWRTVLGREEALLAEVGLAVEVQRRDAVAALSQLTSRDGHLAPFLDAWIPARSARIAGDVPQAIAHLLGGAETARGIARAELLTEAAWLILQATLESGDSSDDVTSRALEHLAHAHEALVEGRATDPRGRFVAVWLSAVGGLACLAADRPLEAEQTLDRAVRSLSHLSSPRAARLAAELRIEEIRVLHRTDRTAAAAARLQAARSSVRLPGLRVRVEEVARSLARGRSGPAPACPAVSTVTPQRIHLEPPPSP